MASLIEKLRRILAGEKKGQLESDEFWTVYESLRQAAPGVKYQNPDCWVHHDK